MTSTPSAEAGSLQGLRVVEIGTSVAAPFAGQILGDLGADVVKVERLDTGDDSRSWAPPEWDGQSVTFLALNRNKRSIAVDYKTQEGREVLERLIASSDVLIQNLRPGTLSRSGFSAEELEALNPRLIYCELTGFGPSGPRAGEPAYDPLMQAYSGIVSITGENGSSPSRVPVSLLDMGTGMWTVIAVFEALRRREQTGRGGHVELSLLQTALTWLSMPLTSVLAGNGAPERLGSGLAGVVPYGAFPAADGDVFVSAGNNDAWARLCAAIEAPDLRDTDGFTTNEGRVRRRAEVTAALSARTSQLTVVDLVARLKGHGVPCSPVQTLDQVAVDEQVEALGSFSPLPHPDVADFQVLNLPMTFDGTRPPHTAAPPPLGADTESVLADLGYSAADVADLLSRRVLGSQVPATTSGGRR